VTAPVRIAAIDIGTVTTRLLVADVSEAGIIEIERSTDITHLGSGLTAAGVLSDESMDRVADIIGGYALRTDVLGVERTSAVATSAARDAANTAELLDLLGSRGIRPETIAGEREALLSFSGATYGVNGNNLLVVDVGGGSTELVLGDARVGAEPELVASHSFNVGSRRLTEMHVRTDPPATAQIDAVRAHAAEEMGTFFTDEASKPGRMISVAGTATTLAAIVLEMEPYDPVRVQGFDLSGTAIRELTTRLAQMPLQQRKEVTGLHPDRASVIVAGSAILGAALDLSGLDSTTVSDQDILYGILLDTYRRP